MAGVEPGALGGLREREAAFEMGDEMGHAMRPHDRQRRVEPALRQRRNLLERPRGEHRLEARVDALIEKRAVGREKEARPFARGEQRRPALTLERSERPAGGGQDFERPQGALAVGGLEPRRRHRIEALELGVQLGGRAALRPLSGRRADPIGHVRHIRQPLRQRPEVKSGAAGEDDRPLAGLAESRARPAEPAADRMVDGAVDFAEEPMRRAPLLARARPGGQDPQIRVDLHRIGVDNRGVESFREFERDGRLAARRRACNEERPPQSLVSEHLSGSRMSALVVTLVADPAEIRLTDAGIAGIAQATPGFERWRWLDEGVAADLFFEAELAPARARLATALDGQPIDAIVQPAQGREKRLLVADMDSTLIGQECVDELADYAGVGAKVAAITERAMRGEIAFEPALRERVALLAGLPASVIDEALRDRITLNPGARTLARTMRARGARIAIVSGGFRQFTRAIAEQIGADEDRANELAVADGRLTGKVVEPVLGRHAKLAALRDIAATMGLGMAETTAIGDGANDLAMLEASGLGVAYRAKPKVAAAAAARIDHGDLTALLYAQGIARKDFAEG